jgi:hypothetical protein
MGYLSHVESKLLISLYLSGMSRKLGPLAIALYVVPRQLL